MGRERARLPEDLSRQFLARASSGDLEGLVAMYEPEAVLARSGASSRIGHAAIREFYRGLLADPPLFAGTVLPAVRCGDLALTSVRFRGGVSAEVARRQPDGSWLWVIDQPNLLG